MRNLGVQLPPVTLERRGSPLRELFHFILAFAAMFGAAFVAIGILF